ncbi:helix-turn-helix transcriptional regulator [Rhizobium leucaenae]|uniref:helix-turn-helix domain-containing protein n=1 Tax=Rhizobium leucaenae TaxID=29450 RepID=UPI0031B9B738
MSKILIFSVSYFSVYLKCPNEQWGNFLEKTVWSKGNEALVELIKSKRKEAGLTQTEVAKAFGQRQTWLSHLESGERRIDVVEFVRLSEVIGFSAVDELRKLIPIILEK